MPNKSKKYKFYSYVVFILFLIIPTYSQSNMIVDSLIKNKEFLLDEVNVVKQNSLEIKYQNRLLKLNQDYSYNAIRQMFQLRHTLSKKVDTLYIEYKTYQIPKYFKYYSKPELFSEKANFKAAVVNKTNNDKKTNSINTSGAFFRGFRVTTNQQLSLESGMNLQLKGDLGNGVFLKSILRDEKSPIQPEGTTKYLSDIDKIFIQLESNHGKVLLGDIDFKPNIDPLFNYDNRVQGLSISQKSKKINSGLSFTTSRGNKHRFRFITEENLQGPYQILGKNLERDILIIAGSEKVFMDNKKLIRGENNDYIMEYGNANLVFSNNIHIGSNREVIVEFEYVASDQRFGKKIQKYNSSYSNNYIDLGIQFIEEKDNVESPLESKNGYTFDESELLTNSTDGLELIELTSVTKNVSGFYIKEYNSSFNDTVLVYSPTSNGEKFHATFLFVGSNKGDYKRISRFQNEYEYVGKKLGSFLPIKRLYKPKKHRVIVGKSNFKISDDQSFSLKFARSEIDKNILSNTSKKNDYSGGFTELNYELKNGKIFGVLFSSKSSFKSHQKLFNYVQPFYSSEYQNDWNLSDEPQFGNRTSLHQELNFSFSKNHSSELSFSSISEGDSITGVQFNGHSEIKSDKTFISIGAKYLEYTNSFLRERTDLFHGSFKAELILNKFKPSYYSEIISRNYFNYQLNSYKKYLNKLGLEYQPNKSFKVNINSEVETLLISDSSNVSFNNFTRLSEKPFSNQLTNKVLLNYKTQSFKDELSFSIRNTSVEDAFKKIQKEDQSRYFSERFLRPKFDDSKSLLFSHKLRYQPKSKGLSLKFEYHLANEQSALKEVVYRSVPKGFGQFRKDSIESIYVRDNVAGDLVQFILPTGEFEPITKIKTSLNILLDPNKYKLNLLNGFKFKITSHISEETRRSYNWGQLLLDPSEFFSGDSRSSRFLYQQFLFYKKGHQKFNMTYEYKHISSLSKIFVSNSEGKNSKRSENGHLLKTNIGINKLLKLSNEIRTKNLKVNSENEFYNRNIYSYNLSQLIFLKVKQSSNLKVKFIYQYDENKLKTYTALDLIGINSSLNLNYAKKIGIDCHFNYGYVRELSNNSSAFIPYELVNGKRPGSNKEWGINGTYYFLENTSLSLNYTGRKDVVDQDTFHLGRLEFRMVF